MGINLLVEQFDLSQRNAQEFDESLLDLRMAETTCIFVINQFQGLHHTTPSIYQIKDSKMLAPPR